MRIGIHKRMLPIILMGIGKARPSLIMHVEPPVNGILGDDVDRSGVIQHWMPFARGRLRILKVLEQKRRSFQAERTCTKRQVGIVGDHVRRLTWTEIQ